MSNLFDSLEEATKDRPYSYKGIDKNAPDGVKKEVTKFRKLRFSERESPPSLGVG